MRRCDGGGVSYKAGVGLGVVAVFAAAMTGCIFPPSTIPIATRSVAQTGAEGSTLIILLHGRGGAPEDFEKARFPGIASDAGIKTGMLLVDAHEGYYKDRTILTRLREDIVGPARQRGQKVWLVGVSMGGTGALLYARRYPGEVEGVFAIAPFLGSGAQIREILDAGGIDSWSPGDQIDVFPWEAWAWLKKRPASQDTGTLIYVGYGTGDKVARAGQLLADVLPKDQLLVTEGGHDWKAWARLWKEFVHSGALRTQDE